MKTRNIFLIATVCVIFALMTTISEAQWTADRSVSEDLGAEASLVVTAVSGPAQAILNKRVSVTYAVKNKGDAASGAYKVRFK